MRRRQRAVMETITALLFSATMRPEGERCVTVWSSSRSQHSGLFDLMPRRLKSLAESGRWRGCLAAGCSRLVKRWSKNTGRLLVAARC